MVRIECHPVVFYLDNGGHLVLLLTVDEGDDGFRIDMLFVELAVDVEGVTLHFYHSCRIIDTESVLWLHDEVELLALFHGCYMLLKGIEGNAEACDELKWIGFRSLLH